ncbi:MAG: hypothetical protein ACI8TQ_003925, partial [Planctomycetota bacterium]
SDLETSSWPLRATKPMAPRHGGLAIDHAQLGLGWINADLDRRLAEQQAGLG